MPRIFPPPNEPNAGAISAQAGSQPCEVPWTKQGVHLPHVLNTNLFWLRAKSFKLFPLTTSRAKRTQAVNNQRYEFRTETRLAER